MKKVFTNEDFLSIDKYEILYPGVFSDWHPVKVPSIHPDWQHEAIIDGSNTLPISSLLHVTHDKEADQIQSGDLFTFKPRQKFGKAKGKRTDWSVLHVGETFKRTDNGRYQKVVPGGPLFPGCLSWWSISTRDFCKNDIGQTFWKKLDDVKKKHVYSEEADYLKTPPESMYGNKGFAVSFHDLVNCYKASRSDCTVKNVYLKKGGTLRYKHEACYVIMVIMEEDNRDGYFSNLPSMFGEPCFEHNGCIDAEGQIVSNATPYFKVSHPFKTSDCWESLAFAFFFLSQHQLPLQCPKELCEVVDVEHDVHCMSTQPHPETNKWMCPNKLTIAFKNL